MAFTLLICFLCVFLRSALRFLVSRRFIFVSAHTFRWLINFYLTFGSQSAAKNKSQIKKLNARDSNNSSSNSNKCRKMEREKEHVNATNGEKCTHLFFFLFFVSTTLFYDEFSLSFQFWYLSVYFWPLIYKRRNSWVFLSPNNFFCTILCRCRHHRWRLLLIT